MNSSIAASMIAPRRSAARSARLDAGFAGSTFGETILGVLATSAALLATRLLAGFDGLLVLGVFPIINTMTDWSVIVNMLPECPISPPRYWDCLRYRHCEQSEAIHVAIEGRMDCFGRFAPRNVDGAASHNAVIPAKAGIQYAAAFRLYH
jgi:hypothetical protein